MYPTQKQIEAAKRALRRAYAEGCHQRFQYVDDRSGCVYGKYVNPHGEVYHVCDAGCDCPGGKKGLICKHRASLLDLTGRLDRLIPGVYESDFDPMAA